MRIEVTFVGGKLVAYPNVNENTIRTNYEGGMMGFEFANGESKTIIMLSNVLFIEAINE